MTAIRGQGYEIDFENPATDVTEAMRPGPVNLAQYRIRRKQVLSGLTYEYYVAFVTAQQDTRIVFPSPTRTRGLRAARVASCRGGG